MQIAMVGEGKRMFVPHDKSLIKHTEDSIPMFHAALSVLFNSLVLHKV